MKVINGFTIIAFDGTDNVMGVRQTQLGEFEYVVAWLPNWRTASSWGQGHYFSRLLDAVKKFTGEGVKA